MNADSTGQMKISNLPSSEFHPGLADADAIGDVCDPSPGNWTISGFYPPVDMNTVDTAKAGHTVPIKFEVLDQNNVEKTRTSDITSFEQIQIDCDVLSEFTVDAIETTNSGGTALRYDEASGKIECAIGIIISGSSGSLIISMPRK
ncbi:MAG: PxKF domain-containing protein [Nitrososphaera sp.]